MEIMPRDFESSCEGCQLWLDILTWRHVFGVTAVQSGMTSTHSSGLTDSGCTQLHELGN